MLLLGVKWHFCMSELGGIVFSLTFSYVCIFVFHKNQPISSDGLTKIKCVCSYQFEVSISCLLHKMAN